MSILGGKLVFNHSSLFEFQNLIFSLLCTNLTFAYVLLLLLMSSPSLSIYFSFSLFVVPSVVRDLISYPIFDFDFDPVWRNNPIIFLFFLSFGQWDTSFMACLGNVLRRENKYMSSLSLLLYLKTLITFPSFFSKMHPRLSLSLFHFSSIFFFLNYKNGWGNKFCLFKFPFSCIVFFFFKLLFFYHLRIFERIMREQANMLKISAVKFIQN